MLNSDRNVLVYSTIFQTKVRCSIDPFNVYFSLQVADHVIMMDCYSARDVTNEAMVGNTQGLKMTEK